MKLFWSPISPPCRTVRLVLNALKINVELQDVDIMGISRLPLELIRHNPQHTVPTLIDKGFTIWDSHAIAIYLVQKYSSDQALYPPEPEKRAIVNQRLHFDTGILYPTLYNFVVPILLRRQKCINVSNAFGVKQAYNFVNAFLEQSQWLAGDQITLADFSCITTLSTMDYLLPIDEKIHSNLYKYLKLWQDFPQYDELNLQGVNKLGKIVQEKLIQTQFQR
ncbi:glutathione s transferase d10 isoform a-related [Holotrichia oblita]|uniref:Glutathione s transferase d10 isoform a-related n=1 Tax=Holotrichia oblita TaxID=644536 RepID=A0ACB9TUK5_HOLOL|nr:glutathione s transferase d10 isoform a-related [Holotrichia oblita]